MIFKPDHEPDMITQHPQFAETQEQLNLPLPHGTSPAFFQIGLGKLLAIQSTTRRGEDCAGQVAEFRLWAARIHRCFS